MGFRLNEGVWSVENVSCPSPRKITQELLGRIKGITAEVNMLRDQLDQVNRGKCPPEQGSLKIFEDGDDNIFCGFEHASNTSYWA